jgi:hypothetical protein
MFFALLVIGTSAGQTLLGSHTSAFMLQRDCLILCNPRAKGSFDLVNLSVYQARPYMEIR